MGPPAFSDIASNPPLQYPPAANLAALPRVTNAGPHPSIVETTANTPLIELRIPDLTGWGNARVLLKLEFFNPAASVKDRIGVAMIDALDQQLNAVSGKIGQLGGRQNILTTLDSNHASVSLANQQSALDIGQIDYGEASTRLNSYTLALQATQKAYAKVSQLSLFDAL